MPEEIIKEKPSKIEEPKQLTEQEIQAVKQASIEKVIDPTFSVSTNISIDGQNKKYMRATWRINNNGNEPTENELVQQATDLLNKAIMENWTRAKFVIADRATNIADQDPDSV